MTRRLRFLFFLLCVGYGVTCGSPVTIKTPGQWWDACRSAFLRASQFPLPNTSAHAEFTFDWSVCQPGAYTVVTTFTNPAGQSRELRVPVKVIQ